MEPAADLPAILSIASGMRDQSNRMKNWFVLVKWGLQGNSELLTAHSREFNEIRRIGFPKVYVTVLQCKGIDSAGGLGTLSGA